MGNFYMEATQINYRRDDKPKTVDQKLQELSETSAIDTDIAPVFKSTNTYQPGDMVYYRNKLYVFNVEHTGTWAAADVTATDVTTELSSLKSGLTNVESDLSGFMATFSGIYSFRKENGSTAGDVVFTPDDVTRYVALLFITNNNGSHAIYAITYYKTGQTPATITKLIGTDITSLAVDSSTGAISLYLNNWSSAVLLTPSQYFS